jgi:DNA-binding transcriptional ArsR family regulator
MEVVDLSIVFSALADPTRRAILARLSQGEAPVKELAAPFALSGSAARCGKSVWTAWTPT